MTAACALACAQPLPDPVPIPAPEDLAARLQAGSEFSQPQLIQFKWRYSGRDGRFSGEGGVRFNPPDSIRLDLIEPGGSGVQSAVLIDDEVRYIGERRIQLPPPTFLWAVFGFFRPPAGIVPEGTRRGERSQLVYRLTALERVTFDFDSAGHLIEAERLLDGDAVQEVRLKIRDSGDSGGFAWPDEARFRDLVEFIEVRVEVVSARDHASFESEIFEVAATRQR